MPAIWKGAISFGLVSIPVQMVSAVSTEHKVKFHQLHQVDRGRVRYRKVCDVDGRELTDNDVLTELREAFALVSDLIACRTLARSWLTRMR